MEMTKEIMFEQFAELKSNKEKAKYLIDLRELKQKQPHVFRNIKINLKQFDNLIKEWLSVAPFSAMKREIAEREDRELKLELQRRKD
tara:strand:- start:221 stop:481 length:261 start_codon:yes stop_codon:yes gene_type:complete